ncbi:MAG: GNAT family protein [Candidatus Thorarchaeota archaeon]
MYEGKRVRLRRLSSDDAATILPYWNNYHLRQYLATPLPTSREGLEEYINNANNSFDSKKGFTFGIEEIESNELIGMINLMNVSWISSNAEVTLFAIFNPEYWGQGLGSDAITVLLDFGFNILNLHSIYLWVVVFNERAINVYEKIGFNKQGKLRELAFRDGKRYDIAVMDMLKPEFHERYGILPK